MLTQCEQNNANLASVNAFAALTNLTTLSGQWGSLTITVGADDKCRTDLLLCAGQSSAGELLSLRVPANETCGLLRTEFASWFEQSRRLPGRPDRSEQRRAHEP